jgi:hypothetical protein
VAFKRIKQKRHQRSPSCFAGAILLALWPDDAEGLELSYSDCNIVRSLASDTGLRDLTVAQIFRAAAAQADSRGALSQASFFELMRTLVPRQRLGLQQREKFSSILTQLFDLYDWAGDHKVHVQVSNLHCRLSDRKRAPLIVVQLTLHFVHRIL